MDDAPPYGLPGRATPVRRPPRLLRELEDQWAQANSLECVPFRFQEPALPFYKEVVSYAVPRTSFLRGVRYSFGFNVMGAGFLFALSVSITNRAFAVLSNEAGTNTTIIDDQGTAQLSDYIDFPGNKGFYLAKGQRISVLAGAGYGLDPSRTFDIPVPGAVTLYLDPTDEQS